MGLFLGSTIINPVELVSKSPTKYGVSIDNIFGEPDSNGVLQKSSKNFSFVLPNTVVDLGEGVLQNAFKNYTNLISADLSSLVNISGNFSLQNAFTNCSNLSSVNLSSLVNITGSYALTNAFDSCSALTSITFNNLSKVLGSFCFKEAFYGCTSLAIINFPALTSNSFINDENIFNRNALKDLLYESGTNVVHVIHFPSNLEDVISGLNGYPTFGGTNGYVQILFDLPATE